MEQRTTEGHQFTVSVHLSDTEFWRMNLYLICEMFDHNNERIDVIHLRDVVAESEPFPTTMPDGYKAERVATLDIPSCAWARVLLYLIPFALPAERSVEAAPPLPLTLSLSQDGGAPTLYELHANQWGGRRLDFNLPIAGADAIRGR